ncbi:MAG: arginine--tRNA ligase [Candidatus Promineifilaceae bacterium]
MRIRHSLGLVIQEAIEKAQAAGDLPSFEVPAAVVEKPRDTTHGDYATPFAMQAASAIRKAQLPKMAPKLIAESLSKHLELPEYVAEMTISPQGFINFSLSDQFVQQQVEKILADSSAYGSFDLGQNKKTQVEFVSANPTGPLTVGRGRGGVMGDTLARAMTAAGFNVSREYYFNNAGSQIDKLGESLKIRYRQILGETAELAEGHYQGEYLYWIAAVLVGQHGDALLSAPTEQFSKIAENTIFASIRATLKRLNITFDVYYNENDLYTTRRVWDALEELHQKGFAYEKDGAHWFHSTVLGDDEDRVLVKSSGEPTYRMADIAYHWHKAERGFDLVVDIFGADHHATAPTVMMGVKALGYDPGFVHVLLHQFVTLVKDGKEFRMSTRRGHYVTLDELMDEVGADPVRYFMLSRSANSAINFDMDLAVEQSDKNPVYYIQNAHVRCAGIFRKWIEAGMDENADEGADLSLLTSEYELAFLRKGLELSETLDLMVSQYEPHHIAFYAYDLAATFHQVYENCRVLHSEVDRPLQLARLRFYRAAGKLLAHVLDLMGMSAPEVM